MASVWLHPLRMTQWRNRPGLSPGSCATGVLEAYGSALLNRCCGPSGKNVPMLGLTLCEPSLPVTGKPGMVGVTLVGGGPGDPELLTVSALKALMVADVVVADHLAPLALLAELGPDVEVIDVAKFPRGRTTPQESINELLIDRARQGKRVVRLKGGDGFVFGRGFEELLACRDAGVPVTVVPGLTSSLAVPALAGIPATHRGLVHGFTVVSGHVPPGHRLSLTNWPELARVGGTIIVLMGVANAAAIAAALEVGGLAAETPVAVICDGTLDSERTIRTTLANLAETMTTGQVEPPAVIVFGDVVALSSPIESAISG